MRYIQPDMSLKNARQFQLYAASITVWLENIKFRILAEALLISIPVFTPHKIKPRIYQDEQW